MGLNELILRRGRADARLKNLSTEMMIRLLALVLSLSCASANVEDVVITAGGFSAKPIVVFANGTASSAYAVDNPTAVIRTQTMQTDFFVSAPVKPNVNFDKPKVDVEKGKLNVHIVGVKFKNNRATKKGKIFHVRFACVKEGEHEVKITVPVGKALLGLAATPAQPAVFAFKKSCPAAKIAGFDVTLGIATLETTGFAVRNGEATPYYDPEEPKAVVRADKSRLNMYLQTADNNTKYKHGPITASSSDAFLDVTVTGKTTDGGTASATPSPLMLKFACSGAGKAMVSVKVEVPNQEDVKFGFYKECTAGVIPGFDVTLGAWEPGDSATYAIKNGKVALAYKAGKPTAVVREAQYKTNFYLQMSTFDAMELDNPIVSSNSKFCRPTLSGDAATGGWLDEISSTLTINFNCLDSGVAVVTVTLPVFVEWDKQTNISFSFEKECRWSNTPGFDITLGSYAKSSRGTYAVRNGMATSDYSIWEPTAMVREKQFRSIFYLQMTTEESLSVDWPQVTSSETFCKTMTSGPAAKGGTVGGKDKKVLSLVITYSCVASGTSIITVSLPIGTWNEASFAFKKVCKVGAIPGFDITLPTYVPDDRSTYAVKNGKATDPFDPVDHRSVVRAGTTVITFYMEMATGENKKFKKPEIHSSNALVETKIEGTGARGGEVNSKTAQTLMFMFKCSQPAKSDITVRIPVLPSGDVAFAFKKDCIPNGAHDTVQEAAAMAKTPKKGDNGSSFGAVVLYCLFSAAIASLMFFGYQRYQQIMNPNCEKLTKEEANELMQKFDKNEM